MAAEHLWVFFIVLAVFVVLFVAALVVLLVVLLRRPHSPASGVRPQTPVLAELDLRYARGEITREEFLTRRADLTGQAIPPPGDTTPATG